MEMSRRGAFASGLAGAAAPVARRATARLAWRGAILLDLGAARAAALNLDSGAGASMHQSGSTFAMTNQAGGTQAQTAGA